MDQIIISVIIFIAGSVIGSFLNVCAYRIPRKESIAYPASHCTSCGTPIRSIDNIPLISYLLLGGKCRACGDSISLKYPLIELITGLLWLATYLHFGLSYRMGSALFFITIVILLSVIDIDTKTIPNVIVIPSIFVGMALASLYVVNINIVPLYAGYNGFWAIGGLLIGGGFLLAIAIVAQMVYKKEAMGAGDIKLAAFAGLYLGGYVILALFMGFLFGSIMSIALIATRKAGKRDYVPFGPYIGVGAIAAVFYGPQIWSAYLKLAGFN